ncbi:FtsX-like permease family protein [Salmonella enterica]|nr:FtsX-like permease family protein [Salmonella enterica]
MIARWFWREWRSPSLIIVWLALSLAVACVLALGSISDRMEKGLSQQSREFMAGDRTLQSSREVPKAWLEEARKRGLNVGEQLTFATMTFAGDTPQLASVKAVDSVYPMYGELQTRPDGVKPQPGSVLLAPRLMALLNLKTGDTIDVGDVTLRIAGEVVQEPDSGFNPFQMAPRLMMNMADVAKTGAIQPGSRVMWRYKFGGTPQQQLPPESPNYFLINIASEQVAPLKAFLAEHQVIPQTFYPIVRARLTRINGNPTEGQQDESLNRELNLTWQDTRPAHNPLVAGHWPPKPGEVSMEEGLAKRLNVKLGDSVTFMGDTQAFSAKVTSLRQVDWESLRPNFFFIFPSGALDGQPQSWLTSFRWENGNGMLTQLNREFPTVSLLDIGAILKQVGQVLEQVSRALEVMVVLVTLCGMLLLLAQVQVGMRQRHQELVVWRTLGAGKKLLRTTLWCEFAMLGLVAGLVAAIGAETALAILQINVFDFPWEPDWRLWGALPFCGALLLSVCGGWLGVRLLKGKALFRQFSG